MIVWQIVAVALLFTVVVAIHELGHYLFARWRGMQVEEFAIGFGKIFLSRTARSGTIFSFRMVPLGGFVRIKGMIPQPGAAETKIEGGFYSKGLVSRALVLFAGPLFSALGGYALFFTTYAVFGEPSEEPIVGRLEADFPAEKAGFRVGDKILAINGKPVERFLDLRLITQDSMGKELNFSLLRDTEMLQIAVTPDKSKEELPKLGPDHQLLLGPDGEPVTAKIGLIGVGPENKLVPLHQAATMAGRSTWFILAGTVGVMLRPSELKKSVGGPITIAKETGKAAGRSAASLLIIAAIISISLGIINLLPIPIFDGGQLMIVAAEAARGGRRLSIRTQEALATLGLVLIGLIFLTVVFLDIDRLLG